MTQLVKHAPPVNKKNPTTSTWQHQRRAITISLTINLAIARVDDATYVLRGVNYLREAHVLPVVPYVIRMKSD
jgi:hypothetical protein